MSKTRILFLGLALGAAGLAAFLVKDIVGREPEQKIVKINKVKMSQILVVARDVVPGEILKGNAIAWKKWPSANVSKHMITRRARPDARRNLEKARARVALYEGEPVSERKLVMPGSNGFMAAILPKGHRAISVRISAATGAGGFILPNDRVDVIVTRKQTFEGSADSITVSEVVLSNVKVLAIDQSYRVNEKGEQVVVGKTATLDLLPEQAEVLARVETAGQLTLTLRSLADSGSKKMGDDLPRLSDRFKKGGGGDAIAIFRYGLKSLSNARN